MVAFNKFNVFVQDVGRKVHNLNSDTLKDALVTSSTAPLATDTAFNDTSHSLTGSGAAEVANGNGYTQGGTTIGSSAYSQTSGTATLSGSNVVFTASGGAISSIRYVVAYNSSGGSAGARPLIGWWDYGSAVTLNSGETFTVDHSANILTLA